MCRDRRRKESADLIDRAPSERLGKGRSIRPPGGGGSRCCSAPLVQVVVSRCTACAPVGALASPLEGGHRAASPARPVPWDRRHGTWAKQPAAAEHASRVPWMATGTTGRGNRVSRRPIPGRKGKSLPVRDRSPRGTRSGSLPASRPPPREPGWIRRPGPGRWGGPARSGSPLASGGWRTPRQSRRPSSFATSTGGPPLRTGDRQLPHARLAEQC
jgi:hypothetical protein